MQGARGDTAGDKLPIMLHRPAIIEPNKKKPAYSGLFIHRHGVDILVLLPS